MRCMMSQMTRLRARDRFPQLTDAETRGRMGDTEIGYGDIEEDWRPSAHNAFNIGIAIAIQHPEFYYSMAGCDNPTSPDGAQTGQTKQCSIPFEREYHLARCRLWADVCRPDLVGMLGG